MVLKSPANRPFFSAGLCCFRTLEERRVIELDRDMIGRQREQAELDQALAAARHSAGGIILLAGEAGVGKTRLLETCLAPAVCWRSPAKPTRSRPRPMARLSLHCAPISAPGPGGLADYGPLAPYLALLLPELGRTSAYRFRGAG